MDKTDGKLLSQHICGEKNLGVRGLVCTLVLILTDCVLKRNSQNHENNHNNARNNIIPTSTFQDCVLKLMIYVQDL